MNQAFCTSIDNNFSIGFCTLLKSLVQFNPSYTYDFVIIDLGISELNKATIRELYPNVIFKAPRYENFKLINLDNTKDPLRLSYYKLEAFRLSEYDKVILIDSDIVINNSLDDLMSYQVDIGAVPIYCANTDQIDKRFINGGLYVIGKKYLNEKTYFALIDACKPGFDLAEQYPLTEYFKNDLILLPKRFNVEKRVIQSGSEANRLYSGSIIHYVGPKPWQKHKENEIDKYKHVNSIWLKYNSKKRIAVFVHIFYNDVWTDIIEPHLENLTEPYDLYISTPRSNQAFMYELQKKHPEAFILYMDRNIGSDVGPFIELINFAFYLNKRYDFILKLHTKKTAYIPGTYGVDWVRNICDGLLGQKNMPKIMELTKKNSKDRGGDIGMIGLRQYYNGLTVKDKRLRYRINEPKMNELAAKLGIEVKHSYFFAGTMFWINWNILERFLNNTLSIEDFNEPHRPDGNYAHALERMFTILTEITEREIIAI